MEALAWGWVRRARLQTQQVQMSRGENNVGEGEAGQWAGQQKGMTAGLDPRGLCSQWKGDCQVEWLCDGEGETECRTTTRFQLGKQVRRWHHFLGCRKAGGEEKARLFYVLTLRSPLDFQVDW